MTALAVGSVSFVGPVPTPRPQSAPLTALITGAARGIGFELVRQYTAAFPGNVVFAGVRNPEKAEALRAFAASHPAVRIIALDVDSEDSIRASVGAVQAVADHVDVLINNAGILGETDGYDPATASAASILQTFTTNVLGTLLVTQAYLPLLQRAAHPKVGNISSRLGSNAFAVRQGPKLSYGMSKAALNYLTTTLKHAAPTVTFLAIHPGTTLRHDTAHLTASVHSPLRRCIRG